MPKSKRKVISSRVIMQPPELLISRKEARKKLQQRIEKGHELKKLSIISEQDFITLSNKFDSWNSFNSELLKRIFTNEMIAKEYSVSFGGSTSGREPSLSEITADLFKNINRKIHQIEIIVERLELIPESSTVLLPSSSTQQLRYQPKTKNVFIVHGRNETIKMELELFLKEIGLEPIVLHRQADEGMTIIEKLEKHSDVEFAFVLLTPDEIAYLETEETKPDSEREKEFRARPNVIYEFGYFVGKLGRHRVCCLHTGNVALPSDVKGRLYKVILKSLTEIKYDLIIELKAAGYSIV